MMTPSDGVSGHSPGNRGRIGNNSCLLIDSRPRIKRLPKDWRHVCVKTKASVCICFMPQARMIHV